MEDNTKPADIGNISKDELEKIISNVSISVVSQLLKSMENNKQPSTPPIDVNKPEEPNYKKLYEETEERNYKKLYEEAEARNKKTDSEYKEYKEKIEKNILMDNIIKHLDNDFHYSTNIAKLLDTTKIKLENGVLTGLDEQLKSLKKDMPLLLKNNDNNDNDGTNETKSTQKIRGANISVDNNIVNFEKNNANNQFDPSYSNYKFKKDDISYADKVFNMNTTKE